MFDDQYEAAQAPESTTFENPPDGRYQATIEKLSLEEAGEEKKPVLRWGLRVLAGGFQGKAISKSAFITQATLAFVKKDLALLGFTGKLSDLNSPDERMKLIGKALEVQVQRKGEYKGQPNVNVYFNKVLDVGMPSQGVSAGADKPPF